MKPSLGRIVLVTIGTEDDAPVVRPAIVVRVWSDTCVNVQLLADGSNDDRHVPLLGIDGFLERGNAPIWMTSVCQGDRVGEWQWPPRV
jgi:hypothetical protein